MAMNIETESPVSVLGRYELGREIGCGQHSLVRKCYDLEDSRSYAIKIFKNVTREEGAREGGEGEEEGMNHFEVELNFFQKLQQQSCPHPNIVFLQDYFIGRQGGYLVMEHSQFDLVSPLPPPSFSRSRSLPSFSSLS